MVLIEKKELNKKGFTLIELLAVVVILGLLAIIVYPVVNSYINDTKNTTYTLHEADMKTAAANMMSECIKNDTDDCVPKSGESKKIYLSELIDTKYSIPLKDPNKTDSFCKKSESYVVVTNTGDSTVKLDYQVCLTCDKYSSGKCSELEKQEKCDSTTDVTKPVCGEVTGASTIWTNKDRVVSVKCSDTGCGCTKNTFYKTITETGKKGTITITDKAGQSEECEVDVYIDKDPPECELEIIGNIGENGWYGGEAPIVRFKKKADETSQVATYGLGLSSKNVDFNKKDELTVSLGISTVFGYVKDNAGNITVCRTKEIKYDNIPATIDTVDYGNVVYPKADLAIVDSDNKIITLDKTILDEYGDIYGFYFYQKSTSNGMTVTIKNGTETINTITLSSGVTTPIRALLGSPIKVRDNDLIIDLGANNKVDSISRIEVITRDDTVGYYTNQNVTLYLNARDSLSGTAYYTFDGTNFIRENYYTFTQNTDTVRIGVKDTAGNNNEISTIKITNIDKLVPSCSLKKSREKDGNGEDWYKSSVDVLFVDGSQVDKSATSTNAMSGVRDWSLNNNTGRGDPKTIRQKDETSGITAIGYVIDNAGNINTCNTIVKLDSTNPDAGKVTMQAGDNDIETGAKVNKDVTVTLHNGSDKGNIQSGHYTTKYTVVRDGTTVDSNISESKTYSVEGNYTITVITFDQSGRSATSSHTFMIDKTKPVCGNNNGLTTWINTSRTVTINCSDQNGVAQSGCTATSFRKTWKTSTKTSTITISDNAGNSVECPVNVYVDVDKPTCGSNTGSTKWVNQKRTIEVNCNDTGGSRCKQTSFSDSWSSTTQTSSIKISDNAGNAVSCPVNVYVDTTPPYCEFEDITGGMTTKPPFGYFMLRDEHSGVSSADPEDSVGEDYWIEDCVGKCGFTRITDNAGNSTSCHINVSTKTGYIQQTCTLGARCAASKSCSGSYTCPNGGTVTGNKCSGGDKTLEQPCKCDINNEFDTCGTYLTCGAGYTQVGVTWNGKFTAQDGCRATAGTGSFAVIRKVQCKWNGNYNASCTQWERSVEACGCAGDSYWEDMPMIPTTTVPCDKSTDKTCNYYAVTLFYISSIG